MSAESAPRVGDELLDAVGEAEAALDRLRRVAQRANEGLLAGGALAPAWTLETAPQDSRAIAPHGDDGELGEWFAFGDGRYTLISPLDIAGPPIILGWEALAAKGGRLTLVPVHAAPMPAATVKSAPEPATVEELEAAPNGTLAGNRVGLSWVRAADIEGDSHPWWGIGPDAMEWSSSAKLWTAGAKITHLPQPVEVAPEPAAETPADESEAGRRLAALTAGAELVRQVPDAALYVRVSTDGFTDLDVSLHRGDAADLAALPSVYRWLEGSRRVDAGMASGGRLHIRIWDATLLGVPVDVNTFIGPEWVAEARVWLDSIEAQVRA